VTSEIYQILIPVTWPNGTTRNTHYEIPEVLHKNIFRSRLHRFI